MLEPVHILPLKRHDCDSYSEKNIKLWKNLHRSQVLISRVFMRQSKTSLMHAGNL